MRESSGFFQRPSSTSARCEARGSYAIVSRNIPPKPPVGRFDRPAPIFRLGRAAGPATIFRRIALIVIYAVECIAVRFWPHVLKERGWTISPSLAHGYSATTIIGVIFICFAKTSRLGMMICAKFGRFPTYSRVPMLKVGFAGSVPRVTTTRLGISV